MNENYWNQIPRYIVVIPPPKHVRYMKYFTFGNTKYLSRREKTLTGFSKRKKKTGAYWHRRVLTLISRMLKWDWKLFGPEKQWPLCGRVLTSCSKLDPKSDHPKMFSLVSRFFGITISNCDLKKTLTHGLLTIRCDCSRQKSASPVKAAQHSAHSQFARGEKLVRTKVNHSQTIINQKFAAILICLESTLGIFPEIWEAFFQWARIS